MKAVREYKLIKYRDAGMPTYTYFWINENERVVGPYFEDEEAAHNWLRGTTKRIKDD
jgi:hypothetical protein